MAARYTEKLHYIFQKTLNPYIFCALVWCRAPKWHVSTFTTLTKCFYIQLLLLLLRFLNVGLPLLKHRENLMRIILCQLLPAKTKHLCVWTSKKKCHFPYYYSFTSDSAAFSTFAPVSECCPLRRFWWEPPSVSFWSAWPCWCPLNGQSVMFMSIKQYFKVDYIHLANI